MAVARNSHFCQVASGLDPEPLLDQLSYFPGLWERHGEWGDNKPDGATAISKLNNGLAATRIELRYTTGHPAQWNRPPWAYMTEARKLIFQLQTALGGIEVLGRCIISKLDPGEKIPHHVHRPFIPGRPETIGRVIPIFDTYQIPLQVDEEWVFECGGMRLDEQDPESYVCGEEIWMKPGGAWTFPNLVLHSVFDRGARRPRISLMVDIRRMEDNPLMPSLRSPMVEQVN